MQALGIKQSEFEQPDMVVQLGVPPRRIDLLTGISGIGFEQAWSRRVEEAWNDRTVAFLGLEDLLQNERATGRRKDPIDADELERLRRERDS